MKYFLGLNILYTDWYDWNPYSDLLAKENMIHSEIAKENVFHNIIIKYHFFTPEDSWQTTTMLKDNSMH